MNCTPLIYSCLQNNISDRVIIMEKLRLILYVGECLLRL